MCSATRERIISVMGPSPPFLARGEVTLSDVFEHRVHSSLSYSPRIEETGKNKEMTRNLIYSEEREFPVYEFIILKHSRFLALTEITPGFWSSPN